MSIDTRLTLLEAALEEMPRPLLLVDRRGDVRLASLLLQKQLFGERTTLTDRPLREVLGFLPGVGEDDAQRFLDAVDRLAVPTASTDPLELGSFQGWRWVARSAARGAGVLLEAECEASEDGTIGNPVLKRLVQRLPDPAVYVAGDALHPNGACQRLLGYTLEQIGTMEGWFQHLYPGHGDQIRRLYEDDRNSPVADSREVTVTCRSGDRRLVRFTGFEDDGGAVWFLQDVTHPARLSRLLKISEEASSGGGWELDSGSMQVHCTPELLRLLDIDGQGAITSLPGLLDYFRDGWRAQVASAVLHAIDSGEPFGLDAEMVTATGRAIWVRLDARSEDLPGGRGRAVSGTIYDRSAERAQERRLADLSEKLLLVTRGARIGVWEWEVQSGAVTWDAPLYALHGLSPGEFGGDLDSWQELLFAEDRGRVSNLLNQAVWHGKPFDAEYRVRRADGSIATHRSYAVVQSSPSGSPRVLGVTWATSDRARSNRPRMHLTPPP